MTSEKALHFEDVEVGSEITPLIKGPITTMQIARYAGASGDFNPIHYDEGFAKKAGLGGVIAHGMLSMAFAAQMMTDWVGNGNLKRLKVRFSGMVRPGDTLTFKGKVVKKYQEKGEKYLICEISSENQRGENTLTGEADVTLP